LRYINTLTYLLTYLLCDPPRITLSHRITRCTVHTVRLSSVHLSVRAVLVYYYCFDFDVSYVNVILYFTYYTVTCSKCEIDIIAIVIVIENFKKPDSEYTVVSLSESDRLLYTRRQQHKRTTDVLRRYCHPIVK